MKQKSLQVAVIIVAAGSSSRMGNGIKKEYLILNDQSVIMKAVEPFVDSKLFSKFVIVLSEKTMGKGQKILSSLEKSVNFIYVKGGTTRQDSVYNGLLALEKEAPDFVLIHDGARPWITETVIKNVFNRTTQGKAVIPVISSVNAMKTINSKGIVDVHLKRESTVSAQTPQGFVFSEIMDCHKTARSDKIIYIDDAELFGAYKGKVVAVPGDPVNHKITNLLDLKGR